MDPSDGTWWWEHGLDGLIGALIGGAITAFAVLATLRHERRMSDLQECRAVASKLHAALWRLQRDLRSPDLSTELDLRDSYAMCMELSARARRRWPKFSSALSDQVLTVVDETEKSEGAASATAARALLVMISMWIGDPQLFDQSRFRRWIVRPIRRVFRRS